MTPEREAALAWLTTLPVEPVNFLRPGVEHALDRRIARVNRWMWRLRLV